MLTALIAVPFLIVSRAYASHSSGLLSIFRAYKTGVLRVLQDDINDEWLQYYQLLPTKQSVDRISQLLLKDSVPDARPEDGFFASVFTKVLRYGLGCDTVKTPQNVLVMALKKRAGTDMHLAAGFVIKYAIFKTLLYEGLSKEEATVLKSISSETPLCLEYWLQIGKLLDSLVSSRSGADLFAALVCSSNFCAVEDAFYAFTQRWPDVINKLVEEYIICNQKYSIEITTDFFSHLPVKSNYDLVRTGLFTWRPDSALAVYLYILSQFSGSPSEEVKWLCLQKEPRCLVYEQVPQQAEGNLLIAMEEFDPKRIPRELWISVLLYHDNPWFQVYTVPLVCKSWQSLHHILLSRSLAVQKVFVRYWNGILAEGKTLTCRLFPWNYFLNSTLALLTYSLVCLENLQPGIGNQKIEWMESNWQQLAQQISNGEYPMPLASYLNLYVRLCKVLGRPLVLYQLPSISDEEYTALIREFIVMHKIVPLIPARFLGEDCRMFVQMLERDNDLIILLAKSGLQRRNRLAICLFLSKHHVPPKVDSILCKALELYRLLKSVSLGTILQNPAEGSDTGQLSCGPDLETLRKSIRDHCFGWYCKDDARDSELMRSIKRDLSLTVMMLLCQNCQDYSEEEFCAIQRVLELCGIFDQDSKSYVYGQHVSMLLNDPKFAIELAC